MATLHTRGASEEEGRVVIGGKWWRKGGMKWAAKSRSSSGLLNSRGRLRASRSMRMTGSRPAFPAKRARGSNCLNFAGGSQAFDLAPTRSVDCSLWPNRECFGQTGTHFSRAQLWPACSSWIPQLFRRRPSDSCLSPHFLYATEQASHAAPPSAATPLEER